MTAPYEFIPGDPKTGLLLIADHASNHVPDGIDLGIAPALLNEHIAIDIGVAPLGKVLGERLCMACILGGVSRLVVDLNREEDARGIIPQESDGHKIPGNDLRDAERRGRIERYWQPYHNFIASCIVADQPRMLVSLHSFTPHLETAPATARPWEVGILYNQDERAARIAIPHLEAAGVVTGDQQPYSGKLLNATMNTHGEANGVAYLGIEMRQDLIGDVAGVMRWADILAPVIVACRDGI